MKTTIVRNTLQAGKRFISFSGYYDVSPNFVAPHATIIGLDGKELSIPPTSISPSKPIKFPTTSDINDMIDSNFLVNGGTPLKFSPGKENPYIGGFYSFVEQEKEGVSIAKKCSDKNLATIPIVFIGGLDGARSLAAMRSSLYPLRKALGVENNKDIAIYCPGNEGENPKQRFIEGAARYYDTSYIANRKESENFYNKILKPRLFDSNGKIKKYSEMSRVALVGFSIGSRELEYHMNFAHEKVLEYLSAQGYSESEQKEIASKCFGKILSVNFASPINWENIKIAPPDLIDSMIKGDATISDLEKYRKDNGYYSDTTHRVAPGIRINVRSALDKGTAKPPNDIANFHMSKVFGYDVNMFRLHEGGDVDMDLQRIMYVSGLELAPDVMVKTSGLAWNGSVNDIKRNGLGHDMEGYAASCYNHPILREGVIDRIKSFINTGSKNVDLDNGQSNGTKNIAYIDGKKPSREEELNFRTNWRTDHIRRCALGIGLQSVANNNSNSKGVDVNLGGKSY